VARSTPFRENRVRKSIRRTRTNARSTNLSISVIENCKTCVCYCMADQWFTSFCPRATCSLQRDRRSSPRGRLGGMSTSYGDGAVNPPLRALSGRNRERMLALRVLAPGDDDKRHPVPEAAGPLKQAGMEASEQSTSNTLHPERLERVMRWGKLSAILTRHRSGGGGRAHSH